MSETTDLTQRAELNEQGLRQWLSHPVIAKKMNGCGSIHTMLVAVAADVIRDLSAALVQAEQREAVLERIIEIYEAQLARVEDSQYAAPLATASKD